MRNSTARAFVTVLALASFLLALTLSASPQLHERIHPDANRGSHPCAVTLIASGNVDHSPTALSTNTPPPIEEFKVPKLNEMRIRALFLHGAVFEHAPPASA